MRGVCLALIALVALGAAVSSVGATASVDGSDDWIQPAFVETLTEDATIMGMQAGVESHAYLAAQLAATITAEGKTESEVQAEVDARAADLWAQFKKQFGRTYTNEAAKFAVFTSNLLRIASMNAKAAFSKVPKAARVVYSHLSAFADLTEQEFKAMLGSVKPSKQRTFKVSPPAPKRFLAGHGTVPLGKTTKFLELETVIDTDADTDADVGADTESELDADAEADMESEQGPVAAATPSATPTPPSPAPVNNVPPVDCDWRFKSSPIRQQGRCGSCWAHSAMATLETAWAIKNPTLPPIVLAPQQLLNCIPTAGCKGGQADEALQWLKDNGGATSEKRQPYNGWVDKKCILAKDAKAPRGMFGGGKPDTPEPIPTPLEVSHPIPICSWAHDLFNKGACVPDENELGHQLSSSGVFSVNIDADQMQFYRGGIIDASSGCSNMMAKQNHAVNLEGLGTDLTTGVRFWRVRNSWSANWGEQGRFRLLFGKNTCGVGNHPVKVTVV